MADETLEIPVLLDTNAKMCESETLVDDSNSGFEMDETETLVSEIAGEEEMKKENSFEVEIDRMCETLVDETKTDCEMDETETLVSEIAGEEEKKKENSFKVETGKMWETLVDETETGCEMDETETLVSDIAEVEEEKKKKENRFRAEIDTSLPFESVKEAVTLFGGSGVWKPQPHKNSETENAIEEFDMSNVEEEAAKLEKDLILKERETLEVLKELETTKRIVHELNLRLQSEVSVNTAIPDSDIESTKINHVTEKENQNPEVLVEIQRNFNGGLSLVPSSSPGLILMELKQAKVNLSRTTGDLAGIRASVDSLNKKLEKERITLKKTQERLRLNSAKVSSLEEELNQTRMKIKSAKDGEIKDTSENPTDISKELQKLSAESEKFKQIAETAKSEVLRAMSEIEQTKISTRTAEIRLVAAMKMVEAARATEAAALAEIKALSNTQSLSEHLGENPDGVTLSLEEHASLTRKAEESKEISKKRVLDAMLHIDEANESKMEILKKVEEAAEEVKTSKKLLNEALTRVDAANKGKLAVEEALRKWRSDHGQKRRSFQNSKKFKNSYPSHHRRGSRQFDLNELNLVNNESKLGLNQTLSIGEILCRKLLSPEEIQMRMEKENVMGKPKVSLAQMLGKQSGPLSPPPELEEEKESTQNQVSSKRKKFGFARFSLLLTKESKKHKKKHAPR